jgi:hypothetical protein
MEYYLVTKMNETVEQWIKLELIMFSKQARLKKTSVAFLSYVESIFTKEWQEWKTGSVWEWGLVGGGEQQERGEGR